MSPTIPFSTCVDALEVIAAGLPAPELPDVASGRYYGLTDQQAWVMLALRAPLSPRPAPHGAKRGRASLRAYGWRNGPAGAQQRRNEV